MEIPRELRSQDFWLELRKEVFPDGRIGENECDAWSIKTYRLLEALGFAEFFEAMRISNQKIPELKKNGLKFHKWLELRVADERIFLADGTTGQIFSRYPSGFYGRVEEIPFEMSDFYNRSAKIDTPNPRRQATNIINYSPVYFR